MTPEYHAWLVEQFAPLGRLTVRRVFGFHGLYIGETMVGLVADARIYLKTDELSRKNFEREGSAVLRYTGRDGEPHVTSYWEVPERLHDEPEEFVRWARKSLEIALASPTAERKRKQSGNSRSARQPVGRRTRS
jgi:DNA transformation protein